MDVLFFLSSEHYLIILRHPVFFYYSWIPCIFLKMFLETLYLFNYYYTPCIFILIIPVEQGLILGYLVTVSIDTARFCSAHYSSCLFFAKIKDKRFWEFSRFYFLLKYCFSMNTAFSKYCSFVSFLLICIFIKTSSKNNNKNW